MTSAPGWPAQSSEALERRAAGAPSPSAVLDAEDGAHDDLERDRLRVRAQRERLARGPRRDARSVASRMIVAVAVACARRGRRAASACAGACARRRRAAAASASRASGAGSRWPRRRWCASGPAVKTVAHVSGSPSMTHGDRIDAHGEDVAVALALARGVTAAGARATRAICAARGARGPGGRPAAFMNASVHSRAMPAPATATAEEILDVNRRYHDVAAADYDAKWGIDFGEVGRAQVLGKVAQAARRRARPVRALAGDRRRHRLLHAQPAAGRASSRDADVHRHLARDARRRCEANARAARPRRRDRRLRRRGAAVRGRRASTSSSATPCCTTCPTSTARSREFRRVLRPGGTLFFAGEPSRHGDRIAAVPKRAAIARRAAVAAA